MLKRIKNISKKTSLLVLGLVVGASVSVVLATDWDNLMTELNNDIDANRAIEKLGAEEIKNNLLHLKENLTSVSSINDLSDGRTTGFSVYLGSDSGTHDSGGHKNSGLGFMSLRAVTTGERNTGVGQGALMDVTTSLSNTALGTESLLNLTGGSYNVAIGDNAGSNTLYFDINTMSYESGENTSSSNSIYIGKNSGSGAENGADNEILIGSGTYGGGANSVTIGNPSTERTRLYGPLSLDVDTSVYIGAFAGYDHNGNGYYNVGLGRSSLADNTDGSYNTAIGSDTMNRNTTGSDNTAVGYQSLYGNTTGNSNTAIGDKSLLQNTTGGSNTAVGRYSLLSNTTGYSNTAIGYNSLNSNTTGIYNTVIGFNALRNNLTGQYNIAIGFGAGESILAGSSNWTSTNSIYLGYDTRSAAAGNTNEIVIGHEARGNGSNTVTLGNDDIAVTYLKGTTFFDCPSCGSTTLLNGTDDWGDLAIQGRVLSANSNLHLSPPGGFNVVINDTYRAAGGTTTGTAGLIVQGGISSGIDITAGDDMYADAFLYNSDINLKKNITRLENYRDILKIDAVRFNWKEDDKADVGIIAQEVQKYFPEFIQEKEDGYLTVDYPKLAVPMLNLLQEQEERILKLEERLERLEK